MEKYSVAQWLFCFYFYCFCGWIWESSYCSVKNHKLTNRGFMHGPFLPLYGSGAIMMFVVSRPFLAWPPLVYAAGCLGATVLEYLTGTIMEALFKVRYWDYSKCKFNIKGRVCLKATLLWGVMTVVMAYFVQAPIERLIFQIPFRIIDIFTLVLSVFIAADFALSVKAAIDLRDVLLAMEKARREMELMQRRLDVLVAVAGDEIGQRVNAAQTSAGEIKAAAGMQLAGVREAAGNGMAGIREAVENRPRLTDLRDSVGEKLLIARNRITDRPTDYSEENKKEMTELFKRFSNMQKRFKLDKFTKYRLRNNPEMYSKEFEAALEELKHSAELPVDEDDD